MTGPAVTGGALEGVVVLDFTQVLSGPFCTMMLADQGARVIKIEPPGGDQTRRFGPFREGQLRIEDGGYGAYFASTNRNKEAIVVDLKEETGRALIKRLVPKADIVVENFRSGIMDRLGLSYEVLCALNPRLVYAAIRGFGDESSGRSPYVEWPAYDIVAQAMGGIIGITSTEARGAPTKVGPAVGDIVPAMQCAFGIVAAYTRALRTGRGQKVDVAMLDGVLALCERILFQYGADGTVAGPEGNGHPLFCPYGLFPASDGSVAIGCVTDAFWQLLARAIGLGAMAEAAAYATTASRVAHRDEVDRAVRTWTSERTKAQISEVLGSKIPFGPVLRADEIIHDPHFRNRDMVATVELPGCPDHPLTIAGTAIKMSATPGGVRTRAPLIGEHTDRVLGSFGIDAGEISDLRTSRVIA
jgi:formyl-CoA transferase